MVLVAAVVDDRIEAAAALGHPTPQHATPTMEAWLGLLQISDPMDVTGHPRRFVVLMWARIGESVVCGASAWGNVATPARVPRVTLPAPRAPNTRPALRARRQCRCDRRSVDCSVTLRCRRALHSCSPTKRVGHAPPLLEERCAEAARARRPEGTCQQMKLSTNPWESAPVG